MWIVGEAAQLVRENPINTTTPQLNFIAKAMQLLGEKMAQVSFGLCISAEFDSERNTTFRGKLTYSYPEGNSMERRLFAIFLS